MKYRDRIILLLQKTCVISEGQYLLGLSSGQYRHYLIPVKYLMTKDRGCAFSVLQRIYRFSDSQNLSSCDNAWQGSLELLVPGSDSELYLLSPNPYGCLGKTHFRNTNIFMIPSSSYFCNIYFENNVCKSKHREGMLPFRSTGVTMK